MLPDRATMLFQRGQQPGIELARPGAALGIAFQVDSQRLVMLQRLLVGPDLAQGVVDVADPDDPGLERIAAPASPWG